MRYKIDDVNMIFDSIEDVLDYCIQEDYHEDDDYFEEWVNDNYDHVTINGDTYYPYDILNSFDDYNLRDLRRAYCENENENDVDNARYELTHADEDEEVYIQGYTVRVIADIEEPEEVDCADAMDELRKRLASNNLTKQQIAEENKKNEYDLLQIIGG